MIERIKYMRGRAIARIKECLWDESGIGVVEIILIGGAYWSCDYF